MDTPAPEPTAGGSYSRDPVTGALTPIEQPQPAPAPAAQEPAQEA